MQYILQLELSKHNNLSVCKYHLSNDPFIKNESLFTSDEVDNYCLIIPLQLMLLCFDTKRSF